MKTIMSPYLDIKSIPMERSPKTVKSEMEMSVFTFDQIISPGHLKPDVGII